MKKIVIEIKWGILFTIMMLAWMYLEKILGWHDRHIDIHPYLTLFFIFPAVLIYVLALRDKKKNYYGGKMTWLQGFLSGALIGFIVAVLSPLTQYLILEVISPEYLSNAISQAVEIGSKTKIQAENYFTLRNYIIQGIISALALGAITGGIVSVFIRKK